MIEVSQNYLQKSIERGFIDSNIVAPLTYRPQLLLNNEQEQVLPTLLQELKTCKEFFISVAFITESGLAMLKTVLYELSLRNIKGRILTSTYLNFNNPKVFKELLKLKNVEVRLTDIDGFHAKGYYFKHENFETFIVGSSNLTANALKKNYEWNIKLTTLEHGELINNFHDQFETLWTKSYPLTIEWIRQYEQLYTPPNTNQVVLEVPMNVLENPLSRTLEIKPNKMQEKALAQIAGLRNQGAEKALVISATGTGKTYLSAFDVRAFCPKKFLFIVHREQILKKAMKDYQQIIGGDLDEYGLLTGNSKDIHAKYLFATIQTISKQEILNAFDPTEFDYILIDEVHKAGASSYLKVINYFKPSFLLGMTATPERTDDFNIYEVFDYNVAYEIRLQEALEEDMLCPFHYFGITDFEVEGEEIQSTKEFQYLDQEKRVDHVLERVSYYGHSGEKLKGLVFCANKKEAHTLATLFTQRNHPSVALTGEDSQEVREKTICKLENGEIDYIFTVDIFNEGIDIPVVNQIIMLRQTQSSIVFIQQLGRGLRKHPQKEFVTIIDFIGNYENNYLIPVALSGDQTLNKDTIRRKTVDMSFIKGISTVNFEEIAKQRIFDSITNTNLSTQKNLKEKYEQLKNRLGHIPSLVDFMENNSIDPYVLIGTNKTYYQFLHKMKEDIPNLSEYEVQVLYMIGEELMNGKRVHELLLLNELLQCSTLSKQEFIHLLNKKEVRTDYETIASMERILTLEFFTQAFQKRYGGQSLVVVENDVYELNIPLQNEYFKQHMQDLLNVGLRKSEKYDQQKIFTLYEKYSRKDACRLLNWRSDMSSTVYGYKRVEDSCPLFVTYHKDEKLSTSVHYGDELITPELFKWYSRTPRTLKSKELEKIIHAKEHGVKIHLFIQKEGAEGTDFYYLGEVEAEANKATQEKIETLKGDQVDVVTIEFDLKQSIKMPIYHYLKNEEV